MQPLIVGTALLLLVAANGTPVAVSKIFGKAFSYPVDGGYLLFDGQPLFGTSKTLRGVLASVVATVLCADILGLSWSVGALFALSAMAGDLFSSFVKRRLRMRPSHQVFGLDQIPESLLPLLVCRTQFESELSALDILVGIVAFTALDMLGSHLVRKLSSRNRHC